MPNEIKLYSHSPLYYWWPVWLFSFFLAGWTFFEDHHMAIVPAKGKVTEELSEVNGKPNGKYNMEFKYSDGSPNTSKDLTEAANETRQNVAEPFQMRVSEMPWLGVLFSILLFITIMVTNVPLRGLWSFIVLLGIGVIALVISLIPHAWETIFKYLVLLRIHINMAGYLTLGTLIFVAWCLSVFVFDRRSYIIFAPGQVKMCEQVGDAVEAFPTLGLTLSKQRDDIFRHVIFGGRFLGSKFGTGDLILKFASGDRKEIRFNNVRGIDYQMPRIEEMVKPSFKQS